MSLPDVIARPLIAGIFVYEGINALRNSAPKTPAAEKVTAPITSATGLDAEAVVKINGAVQVAAGVALAAGIMPRPAALVLAASLVPTTLAGHRFWEIDDARDRAQQTLHFLKNTAIVGGLLSMANSTGGRPSIPWRARRAISGAVDTSVGAVNQLIPG